MGVAQVEFKVTSKTTAYNVVASNPTGFVLNLESYTDDGSVFKSQEGTGAWHNLDVASPYEVSAPLAHQRFAAGRSSDTLYCYDYIALFEAAVEQSWKSISKKPPAKLVDFVELVVDGDKWTAGDDVRLVERKRPPGSNDVGMVAWLATLFTPEYHEKGRQCVVVANDITIKAGSFGTREDVVFDLASKYSRERGLPRLYIATNSGARIGLSNTVRDRVRVKWRDDADPTAGFDYLYVDGTDLDKDAVDAVIVSDPNATPQRLRKSGAPAAYRLRAVLGKEADLGVENLRGSGTIAGESARAYKDVVTLTLVVGRSVGIGAYLVRLGHRTIQRAASSPIILTGYQALNKLLGKPVYNSNDQLGGPDIMYPNGVSHLIATDHMDVVAQALKWLSYVPEKRGAPAPVLSLGDPVDRDVEWRPQPATPYDPRHLLAGELRYEDEWVPGFFDKNSFMETLGGWAKTVVVGRARLGGIPVGAIITENRAAFAEHPADPADPTSSETVTPQAGGVWFPDSAHKTAQAIADFDAEDLPLFIFANWRGFSGGQRDMFDEILKFGAQIVDRLVAFQKPVFVYIPPLAELRGGAWVVVDPTINADVMEMYAAENARGGVLEAEGLVEIKFRDRDLKKTMHRLDDQLIALDAELATSDSLELRNKIDAREKLLLPVYTSVAVHFADLHDAPARMKATGAIRDVVPWSNARRFFYWRLKRRLAEFELRGLDLRDHCPLDVFQDDRLLVDWLRDNKDALLAKAQTEAVNATVTRLLDANAFRDLDPQLKAKLKAALG